MNRTCALTFIILGGLYAGVVNAADAAGRPVAPVASSETGLQSSTTAQHPMAGAVISVHEAEMASAVVVACVARTQWAKDVREHESPSATTDTVIGYCASAPDSGVLDDARRNIDSENEELESVLTTARPLRVELQPGPRACVAGLGALYWGIRHPSHAWRVILPIPPADDSTGDVPCKPYGPLGMQ